MCTQEGVLTWRIINSFSQLVLPPVALQVRPGSVCSGKVGEEAWNHFFMGNHFEKGQHALLNEGEENEMVRF